MIKRTFDILASLTGLVLIFPLFFLFYFLIKFDSRGPVFFRQSRVGLHGKLFNIYKFRTMKTNSELSGSLTIGIDPRITKVGHFLRKYKFDELPQLINVLLGDMSLVGPRPEVPEFIQLYPESIKQIVLSVKPGITDNASIEMFDENKFLSTFKDPRDAYISVVLPLKQKHYVDYATSHSFSKDIIIILKTLYRIFK